MKPKQNDREKLLADMIDKTVLRRLQREERLRTPEERKRRNGSNLKLKRKLGMSK